MLKLVILGGTGMVGHALSNYFQAHIGYDVHVSVRNSSLSRGKTFLFDAASSSLSSIPSADYVINCIGCIPQRNPAQKELNFVNAEFPHKLALECRHRRSRLIHVSTNCVFSGKGGQYRESAICDSREPYGKSKALGEPDFGLTLRASIVGEENGTKYSLLEWLRSNEGSSVQGYTNHLWNGITNLELAKVCDQIMWDGLYVDGIRHIFTAATISKHELLQKIRIRYRLNVGITPIKHSIDHDGTLATQFSMNKDLNIPDIDQLLEEL